ncbi:MAG: PASTA domain-containing protein [Saprospiraceae bacterium]
MGLRDALFELENRGLTVKTQGVGRVTRQSLLVGTRLRGQEVLLVLGSG